MDGIRERVSPVMQNSTAGVYRYVRMRLLKLTVLQFERLSHIGHSTLHLWKLGRQDTKLDQVDTMSHWLKCPFDVIVGRIPCTSKCPHCEQSRP
jgi:hypothetical protein